MESLLARLEGALFSNDACYHAYHVLDAYIIGFSLWQAGHSLPAEEQAAVAERLAQEMSFDEFPRLLKHRDHFTEGPHQGGALVRGAAPGAGGALDGTR